MKEKNDKKFSKLIKLIPLLLMLILFVFLRFRFKDIEIKDILNFTPSNLYLAGAVIILIFAIKSISMFIPLTLIYLSSSIIFSLPWALMINVIGLFVCMTIPFFIGRFSGKGFVENIIIKYPEIKKLDDTKSNNEWIFVFVVKLIGFIPNDISSLVLGSMEIDYRKYIIASVLAKIPAMAAKTLVAGNIKDLRSPEFMISVVIAIMLFSGVAYMTWRYEKNLNT